MGVITVTSQRRLTYPVTPSRGSHGVTPGALQPVGFDESVRTRVLHCRVTGTVSPPRSHCPPVPLAHICRAASGSCTRSTCRLFTPARLTQQRAAASVTHPCGGQGLVSVWHRGRGPGASVLAVGNAGAVDTRGGFWCGRQFWVDTRSVTSGPCGNKHVYFCKERASRPKWPPRVTSEAVTAETSRCSAFIPVCMVQVCGVSVGLPAAPVTHRSHAGITSAAPH